MSSFNSPFLKSITVKNVSVPYYVGVISGVNLAPSEEIILSSGAQIAEIQARYESNAAFKAQVDSGAITFTYNVDTNPTDGVDGVSANSEFINIFVGVAGVTGVDANFTSVANTTAQNLDLGALIPAKCFVEYAMIECLTAFGTTETLAVRLGTASTGQQLIAAADCNDAGAIIASALGSNPLATPVAAATNIFLGATPSANWSTVTTGKWVIKVKITRTA